MPTVEKVNLAILIDAENAEPFFVDQMFSCARFLGVVTIREIYGSGINLKEHKETGYES